MRQENIAVRQHFTVAVFLVILVALSGLSMSCSEGASDVSSNSGAGNAGAGSITATPNPVPAGQGNGTTRISWKTSGDVTPVEVYVVQDGQPEVKFAQGAEGAVDAPWIATGSKYEFRLYAGSGAARKLINNVQVTRTQ